MIEADVKNLKQGFWALGNQTRLRIILALPYRCVELHANLIGRSQGLNQSTCAKHLRILSSAGVLSEERAGQYVNYRVNQDRLKELQAFIEGRIPSQVERT